MVRRSASLYYWTEHNEAAKQTIIWLLLLSLSSLLLLLQAIPGVWSLWQFKKDNTARCWTVIIRLPFLGVYDFVKTCWQLSPYITRRRSKQGLNDYLTFSWWLVPWYVYMWLGHCDSCLISISVIHTVSKALLRKLEKLMSQYIIYN